MKPEEVDRPRIERLVANANAEQLRELALTLYDSMDGWRKLAEKAVSYAEVANRGQKVSKVPKISWKQEVIDLTSLLAIMVPLGLLLSWLLSI